MKIWQADLSYDTGGGFSIHPVNASQGNAVWKDPNDAMARCEYVANQKLEWEYQPGDFENYQAVKEGGTTYTVYSSVLV